MNIRDRNQTPPPVDAQEWQAQERAFHEERAGLPDADAGLASYRSVARALRRPPPVALPSNFAYEVARLAALRAPLQEDTRLEQWLLRALVGVLLLGGAVVTGLYGSSWLQAAASLLAIGGAGTGGGWLALLCACVAITFAFDRSRGAARGEPRR